jgi:hypothetical protein
MSERERGITGIGSGSGPRAASLLGRNGAPGLFFHFFSFSLLFLFLFSYFFYNFCILNSNDFKSISKIF